MSLPMPFRHAIILQVIAKPSALPLGLCPLYVPHSTDFLGVYPMAEKIALPSDAQEEKQWALFVELEYDAKGQVEAVIPRMAGALACGTLGEIGMKWSVRKHWGAGSCALESDMLPIDGWNGLKRLPLARAYPWLIDSGEAWLIFAINNQADGGAFERISTRLTQADNPSHALIALGALACAIV